MLFIWRRYAKSVVPVRKLEAKYYIEIKLTVRVSST